MNTEHPLLERLSDFADGELTAADAGAVTEHVATCVVCRGELARLRALLEQAAALPDRVEPPPEVWHAVRQRLTRGLTERRRRPVVWARVWGLRAAAAVLLVAASSGLTVLVMRSRAPRAVASADTRATRVMPSLPASARVMERGYGQVVEELTLTLDAQRTALTPETVVTLERSLRVIDQAIAEARSALADDPGNDALLDVLSANYDQKVQLLRRASELPART